MIKQLNRQFAEILKSKFIEEINPQLYLDRNSLIHLGYQIQRLQQPLCLNFGVLLELQFNLELIQLLKMTKNK